VRDGGGSERLGVVGAMKTLSDSNTTKEQERRRGAYFKRRVELLKQFNGAITERVSSTQIKVFGDATAILAVGDTFVIPLNEFSGNHVVTTRAYAGSETTITCSESNFAASGLVGLHIAKRYTVSGGNEERLVEMGEIRFEIEGETLNAFTASDVELTFWNSDGYFANSSGTGIVDGTEVVWCRIYFGWKNATDRVLYFGGLIWREDIRDDRRNKTITITVMGHAKELERYPAWLVSEPNGRLLKIAGVEIVGTTEATTSVEGIKALDWKFTEGNIPGVEILSISKTTAFGIVPLRFRFPDKFKYAWGDWTTVAENTASATLTGADGNTITIKTTNYDVRSREVLLQILPDFTAKVNKIGAVSLQLDNGPMQEIVGDWDAVIVDEGAVTYSDRSNENDRDGVEYEVLQASDSALYIFSELPLYGIEVDLSQADLVGTIGVSYSNGLGSWQALGSFVDGTSDFTGSGTITWDEDDAAGWRPTSFDPGGGIDPVGQKFGIKIDLDAYTSGSATVKALKRYYRIFAADGTVLTLKFDSAVFRMQDAKDEIVVRAFNGALAACSWYRNITVQSLVEKILAAANYDSGHFTVEDFVSTSDTAVISILGQAPEPFYNKVGKALLWDLTNEILYLGIGDELWKVTETGEFEFIDQLDKINENDAGYGTVEMSIRAMVQDGGNIHGMAWWDKYDEIAIHDGDFGPNFYTWFFKSDGSAITEVLQASGAQQATAPQYINPCAQIMRQGSVQSPDRSLGDVLGESLTVPFPQILRVPSHGAETRIYDADSVVTPISTVHIGDLLDLSTMFIRLGVGWHVAKVADVTKWIDLKWVMGNSGLFPYVASEGFMVMKLERNGDTLVDTDIALGTINTDNVFTEVYELASSLSYPLCGFIDSGLLYLAYMEWLDGGTDLSECKLITINIGTGSPTTLFDFSAEPAEASQSITGIETSQTILEMVYNSDEDTIHGCLLDRWTFEYHWFVYDIAADELYSTQTGDNFTFDRHRQFKDFAYLGSKVYAVCVDKRYRTAGAFLVEASFVAGAITLTRIDVIDPADYDHQTMIATADSLWGITGKGLLWKYSTTFYPRVGYARLGDKDLRDVLADCSQVLNRVIAIRPDRKIRITARDSYDGTKSLYEEKHVVGIEPVSPWQHRYDRVEVAWSNQISGQSGTEATGNDGWERKKLSVSNTLVQDRHLAKFQAQEFFEYFNQERKTIEAELVAIVELEEQDRVKFILKSTDTDIDRSEYWRLNEVSFDPDKLTMKVTGIS